MRILFAEKIIKNGESKFTGKDVRLDDELGLTVLNEDEACRLDDDGFLESFLQGLKEKTAVAVFDDYSEKSIIIKRAVYQRRYDRVVIYAA